MELIDEDKFIQWMTTEFPNFKVTKSNLAYPTSDFVISYYTIMLEAIIQINNVDQIWALTEKQCSFMNSYHQEAACFIQHVNSYNLYLAVKYIFSRLYPQDSASGFSFSDICMPERTPRRTCVYLFMMFNFYLFTVNMGNDLNSGMQECEEKSSKIKEQQKIKEELLAQLAEKDAKKSQFVEMLKDIRVNITKYITLNESHQEDLKKLHAKEDALQLDFKKYECEEQELQDALIKLENEKKHLQSLVVSDENHVKEVHTKLMNKKEECVKKMKSLEDKVNLASSKVVQFNKVIELLQKLNNILRDEKPSTGTQTKHTGFRHLNATINRLSDEINQLKEEDFSTMKKVNEIEELMPKLKTELSKLEFEHILIKDKGTGKFNSYVDRIDNIKKLYSQCSIKFKKEAEEIDEVTASIDELTELYNEVLQSIKDIDAVNEKKYSEFVNEMRNALNAVAKAFE